MKKSQLRARYWRRVFFEAGAVRLNSSWRVSFVSFNFRDYKINHRWRQRQFGGIRKKHSVKSGRIQPPCKKNRICVTGFTNP